MWVFLALGLAGCVEDHKQPPVPTSAMAASMGCSLRTLERGRGVFRTQCGKCHELVAPEHVKISDWRLVVPGMCWNAGVTHADEALILKYVLAVRKNASQRAESP